MRIQMYIDEQYGEVAISNTSDYFDFMYVRLSGEIRQLRTGYHTLYDVLLLMYMCMSISER